MAIQESNIQNISRMYIRLMDLEGKDIFDTPSVVDDKIMSHTRKKIENYLTNKETPVTFQPGQIMYSYYDKNGNYLALDKKQYAHAVVANFALDQNATKEEEISTIETLVSEKLDKIRCKPNEILHCQENPVGQPDRLERLSRKLQEQGRPLQRPEMDTAIEKFERNYHYLSNSSVANIYWGDNITTPRWWPNIDSILLAAKTDNKTERDYLVNAINKAWKNGLNGQTISAKISFIAESEGSNFGTRNNWQQIKPMLLDELLEQKFSPVKNPDLHDKLLKTGTARLGTGEIAGALYRAREKARNSSSYNVIVQPEILKQFSEWAAEDTSLVGIRSKSVTEKQNLIKIDREYEKTFGKMVPSALLSNDKDCQQALNIVRFIMLEDKNSHEITESVRSPDMIIYDNDDEDRAKFYKLIAEKNYIPAASLDEVKNSESFEDIFNVRMQNVKSKSIDVPQNSISSEKKPLQTNTPIPVMRTNKTKKREVNKNTSGRPAWLNIER